MAGTTYPQDTGTAGATSPAKAKFVASAASKAYTGPSVVDYLSLSGYGTDAASRTSLASSVGIPNYSVNAGNASQNEQFLSRLRGLDTTGTGSTGGGAPASPNTNPGAPTTPTTPTPTPADPYRAAFDTYLQSLMPSSDETAATNYLNTLVQGSKQATETALNSGETLGYAQGQAERVNRNNSLAIDAATGAVNAYKDIRGAKSDTAKARADFEANLLSSTSKTNQPFELSAGQQRYEYDPTTGSYKKVAEAGAAPKDPLDEEYKRAQISNIQSEIDKRNKDTSSTGEYKIPSAARNNLLKYGLKDTEVSALESYIRTYGLSKALEGIDEATRTYITSELDKQYLAQ